MSKPRYGWWGYCKDIIRRYPTLCEEREALQTGALIADYSGQPHGSNPSSGVEAGAMRTLSPAKEREYLAVHDAVNSTLKRRDGAQRVHLVEMVFWAKSHSLAGAATKCHVCYNTAQTWHGDFIREVGKNFGLLE